MLNSGGVGDFVAGGVMDGVFGLVVAVGGFEGFGVVLDVFQGG